jgi:3-dehydroquinate synthetase
VREELRHQVTTQKARTVPARSQRSYDVHLVEGLLDQHLDLLCSLIRHRRALLITTPTVAKLYGPVLRGRLRAAGVDIPELVLDCTESTKTLPQVQKVCEEAYRQGLDRTAVLIGVGGGVCTDIVTVAASWIRRGIHHIRIPTTLIGQVDAGVGIKGAVHFAGKKNYLGCFHPPESAIIDPIFLRTLPPRYLRCGLAEIIKMALVGDAHLFGLVEKHGSHLVNAGFAEPQQQARQILWRAIEGMLKELESNIYEDQTYKRLVDFGHIFSPLLEVASGYEIAHGEAVAIDMALTCAIASQLGLLNEADRDRIIGAFTTLRLPLFSPLLTEKLCLEALEESQRHRGGAINFVVPTEVGRATFVERVEELSPPLLTAAIHWLIDAVHAESI